MDRLKRFFATHVRRAFGQLGLYDKPIAEHVSDVLANFSRADNLYRVRDPSGRHVDSIVLLLKDLFPPSQAQRAIEYERDLRQYVGDYALFMSGMFRAHLERIGVLDYYFREGSRSYREVSKLELALYRTGYAVFEELAERFELYAGALDYLRKSQFAPAPGEDPFEHFLRQIDGWMRIGISDN